MRSISPVLLLASLELLLAAALWGFGFIGTRWALDVLSPMEVTFMRFSLAGFVGLPLLLFASGLRDWRRYVRLGVWPALFLFGLLVFHAWGLQYTTATKSGFITTLYVVFVPIIELVLLRRRFPPMLGVAIAVALLGTGLIVNIGFGALNVGDLLTLVSALFAAAQIYSLGITGRLVPRAFLFIFYQCYWAALFSLPFVNFTDLSSKLLNTAHIPAHFWVGFGILVFGSTILAFSLQARAQRHISATVASLICLLESPFAMIFAFVYLGEILTPLELLGAILIMAAAIMAILAEARPKKLTLPQST